MYQILQVVLENFHNFKLCPFKDNNVEKEDFIENKIQKQQYKIHFARQDKANSDKSSEGIVGLIIRGTVTLDHIKVKMLG